MAFRKRPDTSDIVATITLPLKHNLAQRNRLDKAFRVANNVKNNLISDRLRVLNQLERTKVWRMNQKRIAYCYRIISESEAQLESIKGKRSRFDSAIRKQLKTSISEARALRRKCFALRKELLQSNGFTTFAFESRIKKYRDHVPHLVPSPTAQKIAADVWKSFDQYLYKNGKEIRFSGWKKFLTVSAKQNTTGICYHDGIVEFLNMRIPVKLDPKDKYGYQQEALSRKIHFCSLVRRWYPDGWRYFVQITYAGKPPIKVKPDTGELLHPLGKGRVGNDIGPQTLATVSDNKAQLIILAERSENIEKALRRINRAMDRSRRAMNPAMFDKEGCIVPMKALPPECISRRGKRQWIQSNRYKKLESMRRCLYRKQAEYRLKQHRELANKLLTWGDKHYIETINFQALAKRAKETKRSEKTGKFQRKKRFGKSIANKAPALFVKIYEKKVIDAGGSFYYINTWKAKASQYNHLTFAYKKKHLSTRWNDMPDGRKIQRDLYSAFLIQNTNEELDGFLQPLLESKYLNFCSMHDHEVDRLKLIDTLSSMGIQRVS